jgi:hypothetical protein
MCYFGIRNALFGENFGEAEKLPYIGVELGISLWTWEKVPAIAELILSQKQEKRMNRALASRGADCQIARGWFRGWIATGSDASSKGKHAERIEWVRDRQNRCNARNPSSKWIAYLGRNLFRLARAFP